MVKYSHPPSEFCQHTPNVIENGTASVCASRKGLFALRKAFDVLNPKPCALAWSQLHYGCASFLSKLALHDAIDPAVVHVSHLGGILSYSLLPLDLIVLIY
jgi:hypothetical protein